MDRIEAKLQQLKEIGINGLILYFKGISNITDICEGWTSKFHWTSCFTGGEYFQHEFGIPHADVSNYSHVIDNADDIESIMSKWQGLYHLEFDGDESHLFTLYIKNDFITIANTYGGIRHMVIKKFDKHSWIKMFVNAMRGNLDDYARVFGIPPPNVGVKKVNFHALHYKNNPNPKFFLLEGTANLREYFSYVWDPIYELTDEQLREENLTPGEIKDLRAEQEKHVTLCRYNN